MKLMQENTQESIDYDTFARLIAIILEDASNQNNEEDMINEENQNIH